jgi:hypothetical protein
VAVWWATLGNLVIALSYAAITVAIIVPVVRAGQVRSNRLATATALIFFSCSVGHGLHALAAWNASARALAMPGTHDGASGWGWPSVSWDLFTAGVGASTTGRCGAATACCSAGCTSTRVSAAASSKPNNANRRCPDTPTAFSMRRTPRTTRSP